MNREQKLLFIKTQHPDLYKMLKENVGKSFFDNVWGADSNSLALYNSFVGFYCGQRSDVELMNMLLI